MREETVKYPNESKMASALLILLIVAVIFALSFFSNILYMMGIYYADYAAFALLVLLALFVMYQRVFQYKFVLETADFVAYRVTGARDKEIARIPFAKVMGIEPHQGEKKLPGSKCLIWTKKLDQYALLYEENGEKRQLVFQPSEEFVKAVGERIENLRV